MMPLQFRLAVWFSKVRRTTRCNRQHCEPMDTNSCLCGGVPAGSGRLVTRTMRDSAKSRTICMRKRAPPRLHIKRGNAARACARVPDLYGVPRSVLEQQEHATRPTPNQLTSAACGFAYLYVTWYWIGCVLTIVARSCLGVHDLSRFRGKTNIDIIGEVGKTSSFSLVQRPI